MSATPAAGPTRADFGVLRTVSTRWADVDAYGHVNNAAYYGYLDTAVNAHLMAVAGTDTRRLDAIGLVVESSMRFLASLDFPRDVEVGLRVDRMGRSSVTYGFGIFQAGTDPDATAAGTGHYVHVYVGAESRRPVDVPAPIRAGLAPITAPTDPEEPA